MTSQPPTDSGAKPMAVLREAKELWAKAVNQLVLLLSAISTNLDRGQYGTAQEQLDAATLLVQSAIQAARKLIQTGQGLQERVQSLESDPVIAAILVLDPQLESYRKFKGELHARLAELKAYREELRESPAPKERSERLLKRQLTERLLLGVERDEYLSELARILGIEIPPQSLLILPTKDLGESPKEE